MADSELTDSQRDFVVRRAAAMLVDAFFQALEMDQYPAEHVEKAFGVEFHENTFKNAEDGFGNY